MLGRNATHGDRNDARTHHHRQHEKTRGHGKAARRAGSVLGAQIDFKNGKRHQVLAEGHEGKEGPAKRRRIETEGAMIKDEARGIFLPG